MELLIFIHVLDFIGNHKFPKLISEVTIIREKNGMIHIEAKNDFD
jgi:hypothetical protein